jgi:hypothetical protein
VRLGLSWLLAGACRPALAAALYLIDADVSCLLLLLIHVPSLLLFDDKQAHPVEVYVHDTK